MASGSISTSRDYQLHLASESLTSQNRSTNCLFSQIGSHRELTRLVCRVGAALQLLPGLQSQYRVICAIQSHRARWGINTYAYVRGQPTIRADRFGLADYAFGFEFDFTIVGGPEFGLGIVFDSDSPLESGIYRSYSGDGFGLNVGMGIGGIYTEGDIEGRSEGYDISTPKGSLQYGWSCESGLPYYGMSFGPGIGLSRNSTTTKTYTARDWFDFVRNRIDHPLRRLGDWLTSP